jgi:hypothetical protein
MVAREEMAALPLDLFLFRLLLWLPGLLLCWLIWPLFCGCSCIAATRSSSSPRSNSTTPAMIWSTDSRAGHGASRGRPPPQPWPQVLKVRTGQLTLTSLCRQWRNRHANRILDSSPPPLGQIYSSKLDFWWASIILRAVHKVELRRYWLETKYTFIRSNVSYNFFVNKWTTSPTDRT